MKRIDIVFTNEKDKKEFVAECEESFDNQIASASRKVIESDCKILLLSGPTCSGKTTTANKIISDIEKLGKQVIVISFDDFFKERKESRIVDGSKEIDYDSVDVIDVDAIKKCVEDIGNKDEITVPEFDFITQSRTGYKKYKIEKDGIIIFEGIQAVYPEVSSLFSNKKYIGIFINVDEDVTVNGVYFSRDDIRLARRIVRDNKFRGASADFTLYLWKSVRRNEDRSIYPNKRICTIQLDSFMGYEIFLLKDYIVKILETVEKESAYYEKARELIDKFSKFDSIDYNLIPKNSLYTEFLGKKQ